MNRHRGSFWQEPKWQATSIFLAIAIGLVVVFQGAPNWGAMIIALSSSAFSCLSLATTWSERREVLRPRVIFYADREGDDVLLRLTNVGLRPALDVRVKMENKILFRLGDDGWSNETLSDISELVGFLKGSVALLAPSQTLSSVNRLETGNAQTLTETAVQRFLLPQNENNRGTVSYRDQDGRQFDELTILGFAAFQNMKLVTTVTRSPIRVND